MAEREIEVIATAELEDLQKKMIVDGNTIEYAAPDAYHYKNLEGKPSINGVVLDGNKSLADLGIMDAIYDNVSSHNLDPNAHEIRLATVKMVEDILNTED